MNAISDRRTRFTRPLGIVAAIAVAATLFSSPALAGHHGGRGHGRHQNHHAQRSHHRDHRHGHAAFYVPRRIHHAVELRYRPYYHANAYYAPHHHDHAVYYFPIATPTGYGYEPRYYCDGGLFDNHVEFNGPRVSVHLGF